MTDVDPIRVRQLLGQRRLRELGEMALCYKSRLPPLIRCAGVKQETYRCQT